jgi:hypothetical protein
MMSQFSESQPQPRLLCISLLEQLKVPYCALEAQLIEPCTCSFKLSVTVKQGASNITALSKLIEPM